MGKDEKDEAQKPEQEAQQQTTGEEEEDDEPDEWEQRINNTGCAEANTKLQDCYWDHDKDWRSCRRELEAFKDCWKKFHNDERTSMKDA